MGYSDSVKSQEIGIILGSAYKHRIAKVTIPMVTPSLDTKKAYKRRMNKPAMSNIVSGNKDTLDIKPYYESNYIELKTPLKVFEQEKVYVSMLGSAKIKNMEIVGAYNG